MRTRLLALAVLSLPQAVGAQAGAEVVRYRETTRGEVRIETPERPVAIQSHHEGVLVVRFVTPDSMEAWYEELTVSSDGPAGLLRPSAGSFLGDRFVLRYGARGHVETLETPVFPEDMDQVTDLRLQFHDFFPHRPEATLEVGDTWTDTLVAVGGGEDVESRSESVAEYRVVSDTVVQGVLHRVIHSTARLRFDGAGPIQEQPGVTVSTSLEGLEENVFVVRHKDGRLLSRTRSAELRGDMAYLGMRAPVSFPIRRSYVNRIEVVPGQDPEGPGTEIIPGGRPLH